MSCSLLQGRLLINKDKNYENTKYIAGGFANFAFGGAVGLGMYIWNHRHDF